MSWVPAMLFVVTLSFGSAAQTSPPPLPALALDSFPAVSRDVLRPLLEQARRAPDDEAAIGRLAMALHAWEQWEAAHAAYQRARHLVSARTADPPRVTGRGVDSRAGGAGEGARAGAGDADADADAKAFRFAYLDGVVLQRIGRAGDAVNALRAAAALRADYLPARVKLAEALFESGAIDESARLFRALAKEPAAEPVAELGLGRAAAAAGRHEEALTHFGRAIALFPELGAAHYARARSARALGRNDEAQRALAAHQRFGTRWPAIPDPILDEVAALRSDARAALQRGQKLAEAGDLAGAIAAHEEALARDKTSAQAHVELIALYGRANKWTEAEAHYRAAVALGADLEDAHYNYGVLLGLQERREEAAAAYRQALAINPSNARARNNLGQLLERDRKLDEAAAEYGRALDATPAFRLARFNLGRMLIALGRPKEAIAQLEQLTEPRDAETPRYLFALATAHVRAGQRAEGVKWATEARQLALEHGQRELADAIDRDLAGLR